MCSAATITGDHHYWREADTAARALRRYFETSLNGLWYDKMTFDGRLVDEPAPASSLYHIVCAIAEADRALSLFVKR
jgi:mannose-6-phosphate isomerase